MESMYGAGTDPTPYIVMAFGLGAVGLFGFAGWLAAERRKLRQMAAALRKTKPEPSASRSSGH